MEFEDATGKRFWLWPSQVRQGEWSPRQIVTDPREQLARLAEQARRRGGRLISTEYAKGDYKLEFEDAAGNRLRSIPNPAAPTGPRNPPEGDPPDRLAARQADRTGPGPRTSPSRARNPSDEAEIASATAHERLIESL